MSDASPSTSLESQLRGRGIGRGKYRGSLGKYLRARGRGNFRGRPAVFTPRLVLEGEQRTELDPEEAEVLRQRYAKRTLVSNADRYAEEEPQLDSDGASCMCLVAVVPVLIVTRKQRGRGRRAGSRSLRVPRETTALGVCADMRGRRGRGRGRGRDRHVAGASVIAAATRTTTAKGPRADDRMGRGARADAARQECGRGESRCVWSRGTSVCVGDV